MNRLEQEKLKQMLRNLQYKIESKEISTTEQAVAFATKELQETGLYIKTKEEEFELIRE